MPRWPRGARLCGHPTEHDPGQRWPVRERSVDAAAFRQHAAKAATPLSEIIRMRLPATVLLPCPQLLCKRHRDATARARHLGNERCRSCRRDYRRARDGLSRHRYRRELWQRARWPGHPQRFGEARGCSSPPKFNRDWHWTASPLPVRANLEQLGTDYIDLMLVHWPNPDQDRYVEVSRVGRQPARWRRGGRAIRTSNFARASAAPDRILGLVPHQSRSSSTHRRSPRPSSCRAPS